MTRYYILAAQSDVAKIAPLMVVRNNQQSIVLFTSTEELNKYSGVDGLIILDIPQQHIESYLQQNIKSGVSHIIVDHAKEILISDYLVQIQS